MPGEAVAASGGDDAYCHVGSNQEASDGVDHAVAAGDEQGADAVVNGPADFVFAVFFGFAELEGELCSGQIPVFEQGIAYARE